MNHDGMTRSRYQAELAKFVLGYWRRSVNNASSVGWFTVNGWGAA